MLDIVNSGGYAPFVSALVKALVGRFRLKGIVIVGHCAGSVTALFTAPATKEVKGLILTDPYFFLPHERTPFWLLLSRWSSWSRVGAFVSNLYYLAKHIRLLLPPNRLPRNANLALLHRWGQASAAIPILILKAPALKGRGLKPRLGEFDYLSYVLSMAQGRDVSVQFIDQTNHSFADLRGRTAVRDNIEEWLAQHFPVGRQAQNAPRSSLVPQECA